MIKKVYQIVCEKGCTADYIEANKDKAIEHFRFIGWIIEGGKCYCSNECYLNKD